MTEKFIDRSVSTRTFDMVQKQVASKADERWVKSLFGFTTKQVEEAKALALSTKNKLENRRCQKEDDIKEIIKTINGFRNLKIGVLISVFVLAIGGVSQFLAFKNTFEAEEARTQSSIDDLRYTTEQNAATFREHIEVYEKERKQINEYKQAKETEAMRRHEQLLKAIKKRR